MGWRRWALQDSVPASWLYEMIGKKVF